MSDIFTFKDIIKLWPSAADFGRDVGIGDVHARTMKRRNSIPSKYWNRVVTAANERGIVSITYQMLAGVADGNPPNKAKQRISTYSKSAP